MKVTKSIVINQPISDVFDFVSNFGHARVWFSSILEFHSLEVETGKLEVGYCYKNLVKFLDRQLDLTYQIIEYQPYRIITSKTIAGLLPSLVCYSFEQQALGTLLTIQQEIELIAIFKPFEAVVHKNLERQVEQDLATLKDWLESRLYALL